MDEVIRKDLVPGDPAKVLKQVVPTERRPKEQDIKPGPVKIGIGVTQEGRVGIRFSKGVHSVELTPDQAMSLATVIRKKAKKAMAVYSQKAEVAARAGEEVRPASQSILVK